jgi:glycosyltransferase involved in cell wall biosynthesis
MEQTIKPKITFVMVACDGLELTVQTIRSLRECTKTPYELIVIDNFSSDGTDAWLAGQPDIKVIRTEKLESYGAAMNLGLRASNPETKFLSILNNDLIFVKNWEIPLMQGLTTKVIPTVDKIGIIGPMSNSVGGSQQVNPDLLQRHPYNLSTLDSWYLNYKDLVIRDKQPKYIKVGFLSGFCWLMSRECYEAVGDLETFEPLGFEDNDYVLRAEIAGFASSMSRLSFIHHFGGQTTLRLKQDYAKRGMINRFNFYDKWSNKAKVLVDGKEIGTCKDPLGSPKKLVAGYRVKNVGRWFKRVLDKMSEVADEIVVFDDSSTDNTLEIAESCEKVVKIHKSEQTTFNEARDRETLLCLCKERNPDWIIITDGDEEFEKKFTREYADKLMNPVRPHTFGYVFRYVTHWDSEDKQRADGIFGQMANVRMFRNLPNQHIVSQHPQGFHCNSAPYIPPENLALTPIRIRHYGYVDREDRQRKYEWYQITDTDKDAQLIGQENYSHIIDENPRLIKYDPDVSLGLIMIVKDECVQDHLEQFLDMHHTFFDEMVIVDTGSKDNTKDIAKYYGANVYDYSWDNNFSAARNFAKAKCTTKWCFHLDPDERLSTTNMVADPLRFYRMIEEHCLGYCIPVVNHLPSGKSFVSENTRLFRNLPEVQYSGEVHESVNDSLVELQKTGKYGKITYVPRPEEGIIHWGYLKPPEIVEKKLRKYASICEKNLTKNPNDGMAHFSLALHYINMGKPKEAQNHFEQAIIHNPKLTHSHTQLALMKIRQAKYLLETAARTTNQYHPVAQQAVALLQHIAPIAQEPDIVGMPSRGLAELNSGEN